MLLESWGCRPVSQPAMCAEEPERPAHGCLQAERMSGDEPGLEVTEQHERGCAYVQKNKCTASAPGQVRGTIEKAGLEIDAEVAPDNTDLHRSFPTVRRSLQYGYRNRSNPWVLTFSFSFSYERLSLSVLR
jgi:hypothetical protein